MSLSIKIFAGVVAVAVALLVAERREPTSASPIVAAAGVSGAGARGVAKGGAGAAVREPTAAPLPRLSREERARLLAAPEIGGLVSESVVNGEESTIADPAMRECVQATMYAAQFRPPSVRGEVKVTYPFVFAPGPLAKDKDNAKKSDAATPWYDSGR